MPLLKLADIDKPTIDLELPDGTSKSYDLWELSERYAALDARLAAAADGADLAAFYDGVRGIFEFPAGAVAKQSGAFTLSRGMCEHLRTAVVEEVAKRPERQRFFAALRSSSGSTASPPAKSSG